MKVRLALSPDEGNGGGAASGDKGDETLITDGNPQDTTPSEKGAPPELPHEWMNALTGEQKADAALIERLSKFERGVPDLSKAYAELETKLGKSIVVPGEQASDEEKAAFRESLKQAFGLPDKPEDYEVGDVELPDGVEVDAEMKDEFLKTAHELDLSPDQVKGLFQWYMPTVAKQLSSATKIVPTTREEAEAALREKHGAKSDEKIALMERGFNSLAKGDVPKILRVTGLGNHPDIIQMLIDHGAAVGEAPVIDGARGESLGGEKPLAEMTHAELADMIYTPK